MQEIVLAGDYNSDGLKEIFTFCDLNDSVFLYVINPVENGGFLIKHQFMSFLNPENDKLEYIIDDLHLIDLNSDSISELVFGITGNWSTNIRNIFIQ